MESGERDVGRHRSPTEGLVRKAGTLLVGLLGLCASLQGNVTADPPAFGPSQGSGDVWSSHCRPRTSPIWPRSANLPDGHGRGERRDGSGGERLGPQGSPLRDGLKSGYRKRMVGNMRRAREALEVEVKTYSEVLGNES